VLLFISFCTRLFIFPASYIVCVGLYEMKRGSSYVESVKESISFRDRQIAVLVSQIFWFWVRRANVRCSKSHRLVSLNLHPLQDRVGVSTTITHQAFVVTPFCTRFRGDQGNKNETTTVALFLRAFFCGTTHIFLLLPSLVWCLFWCLSLVRWGQI